MSRTDSRPYRDGIDPIERKADFDELLREFSDAYALRYGQIRLTLAHTNPISPDDLAKVWGRGICIEMIGSANLRGETFAILISSHSDSDEQKEATDEFKRLAALGGSRIRQHRMLSGGGLGGPVLQWVAFVHLQLAGDGAERIGSLTVYEPFDASIQAIGRWEEKNGSTNGTDSRNPDDRLGEQDSSVGVGGKGVTWQQASKNMLAMCKGGKPFTSQLDMAERIGCSPSTINKAIARTPELEVWADRPACSATGMQSLDGFVVDNTPQQNAPDPSSILDDEDVDVAMQYLLEQAKPIERARINAMDPPQRRELAKTAYRDPDTAEQLMRRSRNRERK